MDIFVPYFHYIGIMIFTGALMSEYFMVKKQVTEERVKQLIKINIVYGIAAAIILITGLLRWFMVDVKGAVFFNSNPLFHIKLTLFVVMMIFSLFPTISFLKWRKQIRRGSFDGLSSREVKKTVLFIRIQMFFLFLIPFLAVLLASGKSMN